MVAATDDPAVLDRRFRAQLRKLREEMGLTQRDVASEMHWSISKLIRIENGAVKISANDLRVLLPFYGVTDAAQINDFIAASQASRSDPWRSYRDVHSQGFLKYLSYERSAQRILQFAPSLIPGLLQTEEYARATLQDVYENSSDVADRKWNVRQLRQELHESHRPPKMVFVLDQAVLQRQVGGADVMRHQLELLKYWGTRPHLTIQVLPFAAGGHPGMTGPLVILEFPDDDDLLYLEGPTGSTLIRDDPEEIGPRRETFAKLEELSLSPSDSMDLVNATVGELHNHTGKAPGVQT